MYNTVLQFLSKKGSGNLIYSAKIYSMQVQMCNCR